MVKLLLSLPLPLIGLQAILTRAEQSPHTQAPADMPNAQSFLNHELAVGDVSMAVSICADWPSTVNLPSARRAGAHLWQRRVADCSVVRDQLLLPRHRLGVRLDGPGVCGALRFQLARTCERQGSLCSSKWSRLKSLCASSRSCSPCDPDATIIHQHPQLLLVHRTS